MRSEANFYRRSPRRNICQWHRNTKNSHKQCYIFASGTEHRYEYDKWNKYYKSYKYKFNLRHSLRFFSYGRASKNFRISSVSWRIPAPAKCRKGKGSFHTCATAPDHFLSEEYMDQDLFVLGEETSDDCAISCRDGHSCILSS